MRIDGSGGAIGGPTGPMETGRARVERGRPEGTGTDVGPAGGANAPVADRLAVNRPKPALPVEAPPGTDPELWSILSTEEREFFARIGAMGPLTYGRISAEMNSPPPVARGGRLNVRA